MRVDRSVVERDIPPIVRCWVMGFATRAIKRITKLAGAAGTSYATEVAASSIDC